MRNIAINEAVCSIKEMIERAILEGGVEGKKQFDPVTTTNLFTS